MFDNLVKEELIKVQELLQIEKASDLEQYKKRTAATSYKFRRTAGVCWYPVILEKEKYDSGERLLVKVSRSREHAQSDSFRSGKLVSLFSTLKNNAEEHKSVQGVVNRVRDDEMTITLTCDELPLWVHDGLLGVQLLFDVNSYKEMEYALRQVIGGENKRLQELSSIILGKQEAKFHAHFELENDDLNEQQNVALNKVLSAKDVAIIHGPPGTGKTTTTVECILEMLKTEHQVLVCAPSNAAVDLLVEKLCEKEISTVRIGHPARVTQEAINHTLDAKIALHKDFKTLRKLKKKAEEFFSLGGKWKRNFGKEDREQRKLLLAEARKLKQEAERLSLFISSNIIEKSQVVCSTLVGASNMKLKGITFNTVFIDEAGQALEPACWIPILKCNRVIFAGDHQQLPPIVKSQEAGKKGLRTTLFEKAIQRNEVDVMLTEQYRMNENIMKFSSDLFYAGNLIANSKVKNWLNFEGDLPVEFIDTAGAGYNESVDPDSRSTFNAEEARLLVKHLNVYTQQVKNQQLLSDPSIGIITPYRAQIEHLEKEVLDQKAGFNLGQKIKINTVDSFQGQERDVIYISLVRSNDEGQIGFLADERRMNVAMTRARKKLVIVGDTATICRTPFFEKLIDYVNKIEAYRSAFEYMYD